MELHERRPARFLPSKIKIKREILLTQTRHDAIYSRNTHPNQRRMNYGQDGVPRIVAGNIDRDVLVGLSIEDARLIRR